MTAINYKLLKPLYSKEVQLWDYLTYFKEVNETSFNFPVISLSSVIKQRKQFITIDDSQTYKRCRVQLYAKGVELRDEVLGSEIKTKRQQLCKKDDFLVAEIDAKNGGYGLVPSHLEGAVVSSHYFLYEINQEKLLPEYLELYIKTDVFASQVKAVGSTNYAAIRPYHVLEYTIQLPDDLNTQRHLVNEYNQKLTKAQEAENQAEALEKGIESYLLQELGIKKPKSVEKKQGLQVVRFKELSRWSLASYFNEDNFIFHQKFEIKTLGELCDSKSGGTPSKSNTKFWNGDIPWISPKDMKNEYITNSEDKISSYALENTSLTLFQSNHILIVVRSSILQHTVPISLNKVPVTINQDMKALWLKDNSISLDFLFLYLRHFQYGILKTVKTSTTVESIDSSKLFNLQIPIPPSDIQTQIVNHIAAEKEKIKTLRQQAEALRKQAKADFEKEIFN
jgi:type I restriction enzyme S subunit